jgi:hypothetical protein
VERGAHREDIAVLSRFRELISHRAFRLETPPKRRLLVKSNFDRAATRSAILLSCM